MSENQGDSTLRLMLISNSFCHGRPYLAHCGNELKSFLGLIENVLFIPYAVSDWVWYEDVVAKGLRPFGINVVSIHRGYPIQALREAQAVLVGGGNTFRLLASLQGKHLLAPIKREIEDRGVPYIGISAGANLACPTIATTNDMPIFWPETLYALDLVPFQINVHYVDADPRSTHMGETREKRIAEYLEEHDTPVIGLREGSWIIVENGTSSIHGYTGAKLFSRDREPIEVTRLVKLPNLDAL